MGDRTVCTCRDRLIDLRLRTIGHPYRACPFYGKTTRLDDDKRAPK